MKWCFLVNNATLLMELLGKISHEAVSDKNKTIVLFNSKVAEFGRKQYFADTSAFYSKVDWCKENYNPSKTEFDSLSWRELFPIFDRQRQWPFSSNYTIDMVNQLYQFFEYIFQKERPDIFVGEPPAGLFGEMAYFFAKKHRIPFLGITASRMGGRIAVYDTEWTDTRYQNVFEQLSLDEISEQEQAFVKNWVAEFISHKTVPPYTKNKKIKFSQFELFTHYFKRIQAEGSLLLRYLAERSAWKSYDYESELVFSHSLRQPIETEKRQVRMWHQQRFYQKPQTHEQYFLFPLQMQPEASTSVLAMHYSNQLQSIRNIAFTLPFPYRLYVKEHPSAVGTKPGKFYKELLSIPQVVLIGPEENVQGLIDRSAGVVTLSSTIGLEAALAGKQTYVLGNVFYLYHPFCQKVENFDDLRNRIQSHVGEAVDRNRLDGVNMRFAVSYVRNTIPDTRVYQSLKQICQYHSSRFGRTV